MSDVNENGPVTDEQDENENGTVETTTPETAASESTASETIEAERIQAEPDVSEAPAVIPDMVWGTGRRKSSVARVRVKNGSGRVLVNSRELKEYFPTIQYQNVATAPLRATGTAKRFDVFANINGGGLTGQAGALSLGIARALIVLDRSLEHTLRDLHLMTRDARMKERKKYGLHGARRGVQFSKR